MLSNQHIQNNWPKIKSQILSKWNKLSESEVEKTHGSSNSLLKLVQESYGANVNFEKEYEKICATYNSKASSMKDLTSKSLGEEGFNEPEVDGFNNVDRHSADYSGLNNENQFKRNITTKSATDELPPNQVPGPQRPGHHIRKK